MSELQPIKKKIGGARPGAGRKPRAVEQNVRDAIKRAMTKDPKQLTRIWEQVFEKAEKGSDKHIKILFEYLYGKPVESVTVHSKQMIITREIISTDEG